MNTKQARLGATALALAATSTVVLGQQYSVIDLGTLGGPVSGGFSANDFGRVAGCATRADAHVRGFVWDDGLTELAPLAGDLESCALGITNGDRVVAMSYDLSEVVTRGFIWQGGVVTPLGDFAPRGVSDSGVVVGYVTLANPAFGWVDHAARWIDGTLLDMGTMGGHFSYAYAASADGGIVGVSFTADDVARRAFLWRGGVFHDLGTLGGQSSQAYDINAAGDVVGYAETGGGAQHAFLAATDAAGNVLSRTDLGALAGGYSYAYAVNSLRQVVGTSASRAFLWQDGAIVDLNTRISAGAGWKLEAAWDVNERGWIVGSGQHLGYPHGFLLVPSGCADIDLSGTVDLTDLAILLANFGTPSGMSLAQGDIDGDGDVDLTDLALLLTQFGGPCPL